MQYQKSKQDQKDQRHRKARSPEYMIDSDLGEMNYAEPYGNQFVSPMIMKGEQSIDTNEQMQRGEPQQQPSLQGTIFQIKNELRNRMDMAQLIKENPIESLEVNIPTMEHKSKSPKTINIGATKEEIEYNIKTLNARKSPKNIRNQQFQPSSDNLLGQESYPQNEVQIQGLPDYRNQRQISFNPKGIILRSPNAPKRFKEFVYLPQDRSEENLGSPSNQMSPNINYEEMNNSGAGSRKGEEQEQNLQYSTTNKNLIRSNTGNIFTTKPNQQIKATSGRQKILTNLSGSGNSIEDLPDKYKKSLNNNMTVGEVKRIMRRFTKIYDPSKNNNGALLGSTQVTVPGGQDELFNSRYQVLSKMNRLSNILLSNRNRSPIIGEDKRKSLLSRSRSRSISRESLDKSIKEKSVKKPRNKFLYVSLAMLSSKGPNTEDRVILRKMRMEKGGVVDLAQEQRKKTKYKIRQVFRKAQKPSNLHLNPKYREKAAKIIQDWWKELKVLNSDRLKKIILIQSVYRGKWVRKNMYDLLYLNYLYICFCKKIEKVLLTNLRPYVFGKLFYDEKHKKDALINLILKKDENVLRPYWRHWLKAIKSQYLLNEASRRLVQIRSNKENKLSILLAFFNKWKYMCRIGVPPADYDYGEYNPNYDNTYPSNKLNGFFNILDATNKYAKQKAMDKILDKVLNYLTIKAKRNKLLKLLAKKPIYERILLRKKLYFWYRQMVNSQLSFSSQDKIKVYEMKQKIFSLTITSTIKRVYRRITKIYFYKIFVTIPELPVKKVKSINDLIKQKLDNKEDFEEGVEEEYEIDGKIYTVVRNKNDLIVIDDKGEQKVIQNYKDIPKKKKFPYKKQHKIVVEKGEPESGNEPYEESSDKVEEPERDYIKKRKKDEGDIEGESLSDGEKPKHKKKRKSKLEESLEGEEEPEKEEVGKEIKKKKRPTSEIIKDKKGLKKPKREMGESIHESEELSEGKTESIEEGQKPKKKYPKGEEPKGKHGKKPKKGTKYEEEEEEDSERRPRFKEPSKHKKISRPESEDEISTRHHKKPKRRSDIIEEIITTKEGKKIIRKIQKEPSSSEEEYTERIIEETDSDGNITRKKIKVPIKKKPKDKRPKDKHEVEEEEPSEEIDKRTGKPKKVTKKPKTKKIKTKDGRIVEIPVEEEPSDEYDEASGGKRPKTLPKKPKKTKYVNRDGEIVEEEEPSEESAEAQPKKPTKYTKPKTVDKRKKPKEDEYEEPSDKKDKTKTKKIPKKPKTKFIKIDGKLVEVLVPSEEEPSEGIEEITDKKKPTKKPTKKPKTKIIKTKDGKIMEVPVEEEPSEEPSEEIDQKRKPETKKKTKPKKPKKKIYVTKDGEEIEIEEEPSEQEPSDEIYDDIKRKRKPKSVAKKPKKRVYTTKDGEIIEIEEKPSEEEPSEETREKPSKSMPKKIERKPKKKKYITKDGEEIEIEEMPSQEEPSEEQIKEKPKTTKIPQKTI